MRYGRRHPDNGRVSSVSGGTVDGSVADRQVFTSRLQGRPFMDGGGGTIGRVHDVVLLPVVGSESPHALGLVVQLRRRRLIFVSFGRIGEIGSEGARLVGGTVDLAGFTLRAGEILASSLYGKQVPAGTVADIAIAPRETRRSGWEVTAVAVSRGRGLLGSGTSIVPWDHCRELFDSAPLGGQLTRLREMRPADLASAFGGSRPTGAASSPKRSTTPSWPTCWKRCPRRTRPW